MGIRTLKVPLVLLAVVLLCLPVNSAFATVVQMVSGTGNLASDSISGVGLQFTGGSSGVEFGYTSNLKSAFQSILTAAIPLGGGNYFGSGTAKFTAGEIVNFALRVGGTGGSIYLMSSQPVSSLNFFQQVLGAPSPTPTGGAFYNTLTINWVGLSSPLTFASSVVDVGSSLDGGRPVPIPAAAWLFGTGLIGLVVLARRNLNKVQGSVS